MASRFRLSPVGAWFVLLTLPLAGGCKDLALPSAPELVLDEALYLRIRDRSGQPVVGGRIAIDNRAYVDVSEQPIQLDAAVGANGTVLFEGLQAQLFDLRYVPAVEARDQLEIRRFHGVSTAETIQEIQYPAPNTELELVLPPRAREGSLAFARVLYQRNGLEFDQDALPGSGPRFEFSLEPDTYALRLEWRFDVFDGRLAFDPVDSIQLPATTVMRVDPQLVPVQIDIHAGPHTLPTAPVRVDLQAPAAGSDEVRLRFQPRGSDRPADIWAPQGVSLLRVTPWTSLVSFFGINRFVDLRTDALVDVDVGRHELIVRTVNAAGISVVGAEVSLSGSQDRLYGFTGALGEILFFVDPGSYELTAELEGVGSASSNILVDQDLDLQIVLQEAP
jgi:hypothetical protein